MKKKKNEKEPTINEEKDNNRLKKVWAIKEVTKPQREKEEKKKNLKRRERERKKNNDKKPPLNEPPQSPPSLENLDAALHNSPAHGAVARDSHVRNHKQCIATLAHALVAAGDHGVSGRCVLAYNTERLLFRPKQAQRVGI